MGKRTKFMSDAVSMRRDDPNGWLLARRLCQWLRSPNPCLRQKLARPHVHGPLRPPAATRDVELSSRGDISAQPKTDSVLQQYERLDELYKLVLDGLPCVPCWYTDTLRG